MNLPGAKVTDLGTWKHLKIVVPTELWSDTFDKLAAMGARITGIGPYTDKDILPACDTPRREWIEAQIPIAEDDHK